MYRLTESVWLLKKRRLVLGEDGSGAAYRGLRIQGYDGNRPLQRQALMDAATRLPFLQQM